MSCFLWHRGSPVLGTLLWVQAELFDIWGSVTLRVCDSKNTTVFLLTGIVLAYCVAGAVYIY